ncbi:MAG TPA: hypothetical protein PKD61_17655 [Polyangiaceae bacterium]|nr:hypothetical protein [Polyangiaceae bacterium]
MFKCPHCARPHNVYDKQCAACGTQLPVYASGAAAASSTTQSPHKTSCTTCGHNRFVIFTPFKAYGDRNGRGYPMPVVVEDTQSDWPVAGGVFNAQVCLRCGLTEWYATAPPKLEALAKSQPNMHVVEFPQPPAPRG